MSTQATAIDARRRMTLFFVVIASCVVSSLQATALSTALPPIIRDLGISVSAGQWLTSGYNLTMGIAMPITAFLITRIPTKRLYVGALTLFTVGIAIASVAGNFPIMMVGRIVQACGNAIMLSIAQVIILTIFPPDQRGQAMGWYGLAVGVAPVAAPTIAGIVVDALGWRWIFYGTLVAAVTVLVFAQAVFSDVLETKRVHLDAASFVFSSLGFGGITLGIGNVASEGIAAPDAWVPLVVGIVALTIFTRRQLRLPEPLLDVRVLASGQYRMALLGSMLLYFVMMGGSVIMPLYVQNTLGLSATTSALAMMPGSICMAVANPFAGRIYDRVGMKPLLIVGGACLVASSAVMAVLPLEAGVWVSAVANAIRSVSIACLMMPLVTWGCGALGNSTKTANGSALLTALRTVAGAIGSALFVGIMQTVATAQQAAGAESGAASMQGVNVAFAGMALVSVALLAMGVFGVHKKQA